MRLTRRRLLGTLALAPWSLGEAAADRDDGWTRLEQGNGPKARLGVLIVAPDGAVVDAHRADERFPMCSTFKWLAVAAALQGVDRGRWDLDRRLELAVDDLVEYSPVARLAVERGHMTLAETCDAALTRSDNTAGNLLLRLLGGPAALTAWLRARGDGVSQLDRWETALNEALPGDRRDTTTPRAMAHHLCELPFGDELLPGSREQLIGWMQASKTGATRLRAGLPAGWSAAEKTGAGANGTNNDVGILVAPDGRGWIVCAFLTGSEAGRETQDATLAAVARRTVAAAAVRPPRTGRLITPTPPPRIQRAG
jgi:beta-lactamase class A